MAKPSPEEMRLLAAEKKGRKELRTKLAKMLVGTKHPVDLVVMELIREAAQRAREFNISLDYCLDQFRGNTTARWQSPNESGKMKTIIVILLLLFPCALSNRRGVRI